MEFKNLKFALGNVDDDSGIFDGYASVFGVLDSYNDIVEPGAFKRSLKANEFFPILYSHDMMQPIGIAYLEEDAKGLKISRGELNLDVERARETRSLMKQKAIRGISFGYEVIKKETDKDEVRHLKEVKLWEVSPCVFQANPKSLVGNVKNMADLSNLLEQILAMDIKSIEPDQRDMAAKAIERIQTLLDGDSPKGTLQQKDSSFEPLFAAVKNFCEVSKIQQGEQNG